MIRFGLDWFRSEKIVVNSQLQKEPNGQKETLTIIVPFPSTCKKSFQPIKNAKSSQESHSQGQS